MENEESYDPALTLWSILDGANDESDNKCCSDPLFILGITNRTIAKLENLATQIEEHEFRENVRKYKRWISKGEHGIPPAIILLSEPNYSKSNPGVSYRREDSTDSKYDGWCSLEHIREHYFPDRWSNEESSE